MKNIFLILIVNCLLIFGCQHGKTKNITSADNIKQDREVEEMFSEYKFRFHQLMNSDYFRSRLTKDHNWIIEIEELNKKSQGKLYKHKNVSFTELKDLALAYGESKGKETKYIISTKKKIEQLLAPNEIEKKGLAEIFDESTFSINLSPKNIEDEIKKVITRYKLIDKLSKDHYALRDTLRPYFWEICPKYFKLIRRKDSLEKPEVDSIMNALIANKKSQNTYFINEIIHQRRDTSLLTIEKAIAPVFNLKIDSVGIYNSYDYHADKELLQKTNYYNEVSRETIVLGNTLKTWLYDTVIENLNLKNIFIYSTTNKYESKILSFGKYEDECLEYYYYDCMIDTHMKNEKEYLFSSKYDLELEYTTNKEIDSLINLKYINICFDCPSNWDTQITFAKLKGYENLYFSYVLKNNSNGENTYTPMRALHYVNNDFIIKLWASDIDLFGCSCL